MPLWVSFAKKSIGICLGPLGRLVGQATFEIHPGTTGTERFVLQRRGRRYSWERTVQEHLRRGGKRLNNSNTFFISTCYKFHLMCSDRVNSIKTRGPKDFLYFLNALKIQKYCPIISITVCFTYYKLM